MTGRYLLDTNIIIALFKQDQSVLTAMAEAPSVLVPAVAVGELYFGAFQSSHTQENAARIQAFTEKSQVLHVNEQTAFEYGVIKANLKRKGTPIPENDIWIAATAKQHQLTIVSRDKHFQQVEEIEVTVW